MSKLERMDGERVPQRQHRVGERVQLQQLRDPVETLAFDLVLHHRRQHRVVDGEGHSTHRPFTPQLHLFTS